MVCARLFVCQCVCLICGVVVAFFLFVSKFLVWFARGFACLSMCLVDFVCCRWFVIHCCEFVCDACVVFRVPTRLFYAFCFRCFAGSVVIWFAWFVRLLLGLLFVRVFVCRVLPFVALHMFAAMLAVRLVSGVLSVNVVV